ncbi:MAG: CoB--CoM heterodisulfide reductase iron-sulfur subunit B family protein, partial [bacterium]
TGAEYDISFKAVCEKLDITLEEIKDWICCGASSAHSYSQILSTARPIHSLIAAEEMGLSEIVVPCAACFTRLKTAVHDTAHNPELAAQMDEIFDRQLPKTVKILHPLEIFTNGVDVAGTQVKELSGLNVVCYYGCLLTRPPKVMQFDECEYPMSMDLLLRSMGIKTLDWSYKTDCCGGAFSLTETDVVRKLVHDILEEAKAVGANAIAVACPLCHANLDTRQAEVEQEYNAKYNMPIFYFTQLMGLAYGIPSTQLGLQKHFVLAEGIIND